MSAEPPLPSRPVIGVLHPGAMGAALGSALKPVAGAVIWAAAGRSDLTSKRAEIADLVGVPDLPELVRRCDVIVSICPPHAAREVAEQVADASADRAGRPLFVEANAVSPQAVCGIGELLGSDRVVDAALIGPPAYESGRTVLWLAGPHAGTVARLFTGSPFQARVLGPELGAASGLKACFGLPSKALPALWLQLDAAARGFGVRDALRDELARTGVDYSAQLEAATDGVGSQAGRWVGEMLEAGDAFTGLGLPDGFSRAAAAIYQQLADDRPG